jgi:tetratricopeptide (TPR) repeat protein
MFTYFAWQVRWNSTERQIWRHAGRRRTEPNSTEWITWPKPQLLRYFQRRPETAMGGQMPARGDSTAERRYRQELAAFCADLGSLKAQARGLSLDALIQKPGVHLGKTQVHSIFNGKIVRPPEWGVVAALLEHLAAYGRAHRGTGLGRIDVDEWHRRYARLVELDDARSAGLLLQPAVSELSVELEVTEANVVLRRAGSAEPLAIDRHEGAGSRLNMMLSELDRSRRRAERPENQPFVQPFADEPPAVHPQASRWTRSIGNEIGTRFLGGRVGQALVDHAAAAAGAQGRVRIALRCEDAKLAVLPWEAAVVPGLGGPLSVHQNVEFFRLIRVGGSPRRGDLVPSPLRILSVIANPVTSRGLSGLHERGLAEITESVNAARRSGLAYVDTPAWGSLEELDRMLRSLPYHVLYLTCPMNRSGLLFEQSDSTEELVKPSRLAESLRAAPQSVPLVVLRAFTAESPDAPWPMLSKLTELLASSGTRSLVLLPPAATHEEVVRFTSKLYTEAAESPQRTILDVATTARRHLAAQGPETGPPLHSYASLPATPVLFLPADGVDNVVMGPGNEAPPPAKRTALAEGMPVRRAGEFVGRHQELSKVISTLQGPAPRIVVSGIGGVGKSTLAARAVEILGARVGVLVTLTGAVSPDVILALMVRRLRSWSLGQPSGHDIPERVLMAAENVRLPWQERLDLIADHALPNVAITVLLDNFEDNLEVQPGGGGRVRDEDLATFISSWVKLQDSARLLVTSRHHLALTGETQSWISPLHLGPLTLTEARQLVWRLPALDQLPDADLRAAVASVGGHPRALEYLDALLRGGEASFRDIEARLREVLRTQHEIQDPDHWMREGAAGIDSVLAETITLAVTDVLLTSLLRQLENTPGVKELLVKASVYRLPVDRAGLSQQLSPPAPDLEQAVQTLTSLGLLAPVQDQPGTSRWIVHRWTATALEKLASPETIQQAHLQAARHWLSVVRQPAAPGPAGGDSDVNARLEAAHHLFAAGREEDAAWTTDLACSELDARGALGWVIQICREASARVQPNHPAEAIVASRLGVSAARLARYQEADSCGRRALQIRRELRIREGLASSLANQATLQQLYGNYPASLRQYREALKAFDTTDDNSALAAINYNLGNLARRWGDLTASARFYKRGLQVSENPAEVGRLCGRTLDDLQRLSADEIELEENGSPANIPEINFAYLSQVKHVPFSLRSNLIIRHRGEYPAAEQHRTNVADHDQLISLISVASGHCNLGVVAQAAGDYPAALSHYTEARNLLHDLKDQGRLPIVIHNLATLAQVTGELDLAQAQYQEAMTIFTEINDLAGFSTGYHNMGTLAHYERDYEMADNLYHEANRYYEELHDPVGSAGISANLAALSADRNDPGAGRALFADAWAVFAQVRDRVSAAAVASSLGHLAAVHGDPAEGPVWSLFGLAARSSRHLAQAAIDLHMLAQQRRALGRTLFSSIVRRHLSMADTEQINELLPDT